MAFQRKKALWRLSKEQITLGVRTILTARIDLVRSGRRGKPNASALLDRALEVESAGASIVEVNPGPRYLTSGIPSPAEELPVLVPVLRKIAHRLAIPVSVVTANAETAKRAVGLGATVIHDITGLAYDKTLGPAVNETSASLVLGHLRGSPAQWPRLTPLTRLAEHVSLDLRASLLRAHKAGIERRRVVLDPGLEHGKRGHENFNLLRSLNRLAPPGQGIQVTLAGKGFMLESVRATAAQKAAALMVTAALAVESGAHMLTIEHPDTIRDAVALMDRIYVGDEANDVNVGSRLDRA